MNIFKGLLVIHTWVWTCGKRHLCNLGCLEQSLSLLRTSPACSSAITLTTFWSLVRFRYCCIWLYICLSKKVQLKAGLWLGESLQLRSCELEQDLCARSLTDHWPCPHSPGVCGVLLWEFCWRSPLAENKLHFCYQNPLSQHLTSWVRCSSFCFRLFVRLVWCDG